jgi:tetratricopeptide (TPR) repeat protein
MRTRALWGTAVALTAVMALGTVVGAQTVDGGDPIGSTPEQKLANALERLHAAEPQMDAQTRRYLPAYRAILTRVYRDRDSVTESELELARKVLFATRAPDLLAKIKSDTEQMPGGPKSSVQPQVIAGKRRAPGAKEIGFVVLKVGSSERTMAEIPVKSGGMTVEQRASKVAQRIRDCYSANPLWWTQLTVGDRRGSRVVLSPDVPEGIVITADTSFARERGMAPDDLARALSRGIRLSFDRLVSNRSPSVQELRAQQRAESVDLREKGDTAYNDHDLVGAEAAYKAAIAKDSAYPIAYVRLAALYQETGKRSAARDLLTRALSMSTTDAELGREIRSMLR